MGSSPTISRRRALLAAAGLLAAITLLPTALMILSARSSRLSPVERRLVGSWEPVDPPGTLPAAAAGSYVLTFRGDGTSVRADGSGLTAYSWHVDGDRLNVRHERPLLERIQMQSWREEWDSMPFKEVTPDEIMLGSLVHRRVREVAPN